MDRYEDIIEGQGLIDEENVDELNHGAITYWVERAISKGMTEGEAIEFVAEDLGINVADVVRVIG